MRTLLETQRFRVVEHEISLPDGSVRTRQVLEHPGAAIILPLTEDGRVVLIRNQRVAVGRTLVELPCGTLEPPEPPLETARRELLEETGYSANLWSELPGFFMSPGVMNERMHVFVAKQLQAGAPQREAGEEIENLVVPFEQAVAMIQLGEIEDAKTIAVLLYHEAFGGQ